MNLDRLTRGMLYHEIFELYGTDWKKISQYPNLPEGFIDAYFVKLKPFMIERNQTISKRLQIKYCNHLNWILMSKHQNLDEDIIELMKNRVSWSNIAMCQKISKKFIIKYKDKLKFYFLKVNPNISPDVLLQVKKYFLEE